MATKEKQPQRKPSYAKINKFVMGLSIAVLACFYGPMIIFQSSLQDLTKTLMHFITYTTDWIWELAVVACVIFSVYLIFSKYGNIKLGGPDEKPEFSFFPGCACCFQPVRAIPQTDRRPGFPGTAPGISAEWNFRPHPGQ